MDLQEAYKQKMAAQLKEWSAQIDLFEAKAENAGADMKVRRAEELDGLRAKHRTAHEKLGALEKASGEAWEQIKETADKIREDLKTGMAEARARFM
ncbi:MAG: hypothetical protein NTY05_10820 [Rhodocyclales bacterium]|nr:hypothetical protein [Rhodocyclales bacterium]